MLFLNTEMEVPFLTKILMYASKIVRENGLYLVLVGVILISLIVMIVNSNGKVKYFKDKLKVTIPLIREVNILIYTTRFGKALYLLIKSGVHIIDAIDISSKVVDNQFIYEKLIISKDSIEQGNSIHHSIKKASVFPKLFVSMIEIGEESGGLEESLSSMSNFYSQELDLKIDNITKVGQPVLTVFVGLFVGLFIIAMIMPIFDAVNAI